MIYNVIKNIFKGDTRSVIVKKNILYSTLIRGLSIVISLMLVPMTLNYVEAEVYGIWLTLSSVMVWLGFFDVGFTLGLKNKLAEAIALEKWDIGKSLVSTTYFMMFIIFVPLFFILEIIVPCINWSYFFNVKDLYNEEISLTASVLVLFFCVQMIVNVITAVISAFQKVALSSLFPVIGNLLSVLLIWLFTKICSPSLISLAFAISAMPVIVLIVASFILYSKQFNKVSPSIKFIKRTYVKDIFQLGARFFIIQIQVLVLYQTTNILISNIGGPIEVTNYNIAYKYLGVSMMFFSIILSPLWPAFTDAYTKKDYIWMRNIYQKMKRIYVLFFFGLILFVVLSPIVYNLWIGKNTSIPLPMTIIVCLYMMIHNWDSLHVNMINGIGAIKLQTYVIIIGLVFHIPLSLLLGKYFGLGAIGVILSMIFINIIYSILFTIQLRKLLNNKARGIWLR